MTARKKPRKITVNLRPRTLDGHPYLQHNFTFLSLGDLVAITETTGIGTLEKTPHHNPGATEDLENRHFLPILENYERWTVH
jgi:hypothetical protein